jgi:preprotein translocase subunit SecG
MTLLFVILIILCSIILGFLILVQNPKGGGLAGNIAGFSNQFMGVKQTTDVLEKGTWIFSVAIVLLCIFSTFFITPSSSVDNPLKEINTNQSAPVQQPAQQQQGLPPAQNP